ncbi:hypothetical protein PRIPAC_81828 [Pristionchus pacificus]|uniref:Uncharacterized protein n=1 Tax=Pristionchus pacificus TaxID=54126 RepID=A0A2A6BXF4_PRIPA|nr:hypothetical protein PRIPAC_81828 [Pristionchus pacificus]|eukprot:PDM70594.1 hypothetical protein PRIPAC_46840 [Pristionchus pacificus]
MEQNGFEAVCDRVEQGLAQLKCRISGTLKFGVLEGADERRVRKRPHLLQSDMNRLAAPNDTDIEQT